MLPLLLVATLVGLLLPAGGPAVGTPGAAAVTAGQQAGQQDGQQDGGGPGRMVLVLDASGSMREPHGDGRTRFRAAVSALRKVVASLPGGLEVGLRVYGSRVADGPGSCRDSELVVPVAERDRGALNRELDRARPLGNTPIAYSLGQAARDLGPGGERTVVLVSDGEESCGGNPCQVARQLTERGLDLHVDVVGFQVDAAARNQLTCVAQAGRGTFYDAPDAESLVTQLVRLSQRAARAYEAAGTPVEGADTAEGAPLLEAGDYLDTIGDSGEDSNTETYTVEPGPGTSVHLSATDRPTTVELTDVESLDLEVAAADGTSCGRGTNSSQGAFDALSPLATTLSLSGDELSGCGQPPYAVTVTRAGGDGVKPLEVTYVTEPALASRSGLPGPATPGEYDTRSTRAGSGARAEQVAGSPAFAAAPEVGPGVYRDAILEGEVLYYGARVDWGQQLVCDVTFERNRALAGRLSPSILYASVRVHGPLRTQFVDSSFTTAEQQTYDGTRAVTAHYATPPVRYANRDGELGVQPAALPGVQYCGAFLRGAGDLGALGEVPLEVAVDVVGRAGEGEPDYAEGRDVETQAPSPPAEREGEGGQGDPGASGPRAAEEAAEDAADDGHGGLPLWAWPLVAVLLLAAVLALLVRRRGR